MKNNAIVRIVIWSIVLVALVGIMALGLFPWLIQDAFFAADSSEKTLIPVRREDSTAQSEAPTPLEKMYTFPADEISELEIEWVAGNITIYPTDRTEITISEAGVSQEKYKMTWTNRNGQLKIAFCDDSIFSGIGTGIHGDLTKDLYIYVPHGWVCSSLELEVASADLKMRNMTVHELDIDGASGTCDIRDCSIRTMDIDTASGDVTFSGSLDALDFDAASAGFTGKFQNTPSRIDMDSMSGSLDISLPEDCGYTVTLNGMNSRFSSDFDGTSVVNGSHVYGDGRCHINMDGMNCDVTIRKQETT